MRDFESLLPSIEAVSFDVFDTALQRVVFPKEVFALVESFALERYGEGFWGFADLRVCAERRARRCLRAVVDHGEIDLDGIYAELARLRPDWMKWTAALRALELETERRCLRPHPLGLKLWQCAVAAGRSVCFISDMYLGAERIAPLLHANGYANPLVICSSDHGRNKRSGTLYAVAVERLKVAPGAILHIGDNADSDQVQARRSGLRTLDFPAAAQAPKKAKHFPAVTAQVNAASVSSGLRRCYSRDRAYAHGTEVEGRTRLGLASETGDGHEIGYAVLGPLAYGLCRWLLERLEADHTGVLLCLGRDGHLPFQILARWQERWGCLPKTRIVYTPSSRRATAVALAADGVTPLVQMTLGRHRRSVPLRDYFERIGLQPEDHLDAARSGSKCGRSACRQAC